VQKLAFACISKLMHSFKIYLCFPFVFFTNGITIESKQKNILSTPTPLAKEAKKVKVPLIRGI
jgi:hypothetical protein